MTLEFIFLRLLLTPNVPSAGSACSLAFLETFGMGKTNELKSPIENATRCLLFSGNRIELVEEGEPPHSETAYSDGDVAAVEKEVGPRLDEWVSLFNQKKEASKFLQFLAPKEVSVLEEIDVDLLEEEIHDSAQAWRNFWLVSLLVRNCTMKLLKNPFIEIGNQEKTWKSIVLTMAYLFRFESYEESLTILEGGPWFVHGHLLVLKGWNENLQLQKEDLKSIPIWVKFPNLNLAWRLTTCLSKSQVVLGG